MEPMPEPERRVAHVALPGGVELVVDVYEAASPRGAVIAVHGFGSARRGGKIEVLGAALAADGWTVIAPDLQGHGDSSGPFDMMTVARSVDDLRHVADMPEYRDAPRRALVGSSFGGLVTGWAAADDPALCARMVLIAPAFGFLDRYLLTLPDDERAAWEGGAAHALRVPHLAGRTLAAEVLHDRIERSWHRLAERLATPTLIVHGRRDETVPWQASIDFVDACPHDDIDVVLLGAGDHRLAEHLSDVTHLTRRFLNADSEPLTEPAN